MERFIIKQNKKLRCGYTTGSCAAAAAKAATVILLSDNKINEISIDTPKGYPLNLDICEIQIDKDYVTCAVRKDSGDDPDITNGILIFAKVKKSEHDNITVDGGQGIGRVTKPGLACKIGEAAINPIPMKMIISEVTKVCEMFGYAHGIDVIISAPEGEIIAKRTFNPRLGIVDGISILGTTGIVEPMSEKALIDTIRLEMNQQRESGNKSLLVCPGNYGETFIKNQYNIDTKKVIMCSNFIGEALDFSLELGFENFLLIGHAGKLVKLAGGIMNTHSRYADCRMEILALHAALIGASNNLVTEIMNCVTTEEAIKVLTKADLCNYVFKNIMSKIDFYVHNRVLEKVKVGVIIFSNEIGILGKTKYADEILREFL
jgi:cobalt-precorrin-5B (C1)-methyltransferase